MGKWTIEALDITGGFLQGLSLRLPPGLTCIIGARGTGKSTLTEAIRYILAAPSSSKASRELVQANLSEAIITLQATRAGTEPLIVRRAFRQMPTVSTASGTRLADVDLERGTFLPLDAYSSNEIEEIADETLGAKRRTLLDDLRADELSKIHLALSNHRRELDANRDSVTHVRRFMEGLKESIEEKGAVRAQAAALPPLAPLDSHQEDLLAQRRQVQHNEREQQSFTTWLSLFDSLSIELTNLFERASAGIQVPPGEGMTQNSDLLAEAEIILTAALTRLKDITSQIDVELTASTSKLSAIRLKLIERHDAQLARFDQLQQQNLATTQAMRQRATVEEAVGRLEALEGDLAKARVQLSLLLEKRKSLKADYLLERDKVSHLRESIAGGLQSEAGGRVRLRVLKNSDDLSYQQLLTEGLQGARVRYHEDIVRNLMRLRPEELAQLIASNDAEELDRQAELGIERARRIVEGFREKIDPMELEIVPIEDRICIELNVGSESEPDYRDASELSRGQKCTALLPLLLARRTTPLIIDQPEDNLDNHFIYETVVEAIMRLKHVRQMIFVTHNANIPVLGEADLVVVMNSDGRRGFVKKTGSLDECRDEIVDLLEGGKEAFERRRQRYAKR